MGERHLAVHFTKIAAFCKSSRDRLEAGEMSRALERLRESLISKVGMLCWCGMNEKIRTTKVRILLLANDPNCDTNEPLSALGGSVCIKGVHSEPRGVHSVHLKSKEQLNCRAN